MAIEYTNPAYQHRCYYNPVGDDVARRGIIVAKNPHLKLYRVQDVEKGWEAWIPFEDVSLGEKYENLPKKEKN